MLKLLKKLTAIEGNSFFSVVDSADGGADDDEGAGPYNRDFESMNEGVPPGADDSGNRDSQLAAAPVSKKAAKKATAEREDEEEEEETEATASEEDEAEDDDAAAESEEEPTTDVEDEGDEEEEDAEEDEDSEEEDETSDEDESQSPVSLTPEQQEAQRQAYIEWERNERARLMEQYQLTEEDVEAFQTEPEKVLSRLAADLHLRVMQQMQAQQQAQLPHLIQAVQQQQVVERQAKDLFYGENPDLKNLGLDAQVMKVGAVYRQLNPKAGPKKAAREIGNIIRSSLGTKKKGPGKPVTTAKKTAVRPKPHKPVRGAGTRPATGGSKSSGSVWDDLAGERGT